MIIMTKTNSTNDHPISTKFDSAIKKDYCNSKLFPEFNNNNSLEHSTNDISINNCNNSTEYALAIDNIDNAIWDNGINAWSKIINKHMKYDKLWQ